MCFQRYGICNVFRLVGNGSRFELRKVQRELEREKGGGGMERVSRRVADVLKHVWVINYLELLQENRRF